MLHFFTCWRQDPPPAKRLTHFFHGGLELNPQYPWGMTLGPNLWSPPPKWLACTLAVLQLSFVTATSVPSQQLQKLRPKVLGLASSQAGPCTQVCQIPEVTFSAITWYSCLREQDKSTTSWKTKYLWFNFNSLNWNLSSMTVKKFSTNNIYHLVSIWHLRNIIKCQALWLTFTDERAEGQTVLNTTQSF